MILPDANLLLYSCDESSPFHAKAAAWCERIMNSTQPLILLPPVIFAFVRISTHPRIFTEPLSVSEASTIRQIWTSAGLRECVSSIRFFDPQISFPARRPPPPCREGAADNAVKNSGDCGGHRCHGDGWKMPGGESGAETAVLHTDLDGDRSAQTFTAASNFRKKVAQEKS